MNSKKVKALSFILIITLIIALIPTFSIAETEMPPSVDQSRISVDMPTGIDYTANITDGSINVTINESNWQQAVSESQYGMFLANITVAAPENMNIAKHCAITGNGDELIEKMDEFFSLDEPQTGVYNGTSIMISQFEETASGVVGIPYDEIGYMVIIRWYDDSGNTVLTEMYTCNIQHTSKKAYYLTMPVPSSDRVTLNAEALAGLSSEYDAVMGNVYYCALDKAALEGASNITTVIDAPAGAIYYGVDDEYCQNPIVDASVIFMFGFTDGEEIISGPSSVLSTIYWYDDEGLILKENLGFNFYNGTNGIWPETDNRWSAVPANRIIVNQSFDESGITPGITNGKIQITFDQNEIPIIDKIEYPQFKIIPPEGAVSYKENNYGGPMYSAFMAQEEISVLDGISEMQALGEDGYVEFSTSIAKSATIDNGDLSIYYSVNFPYAYAEVRVIDWYDANGDFMFGEYVMCTVDEFSYLVQTDAIDDPASLVTPVEAPIIVSGEDWQLCTEYIPQSGEDAILYELSLKDDSNRFVNITEGNTVILPFPVGMTYEQAQNCKFIIKHYSYDLTEYTEEEATVTSIGISFSATSFSPYVMSWDTPQSTTPDQDIMTQIEFWENVRKAILNASKGATITAYAGFYDQMPVGIMTTIKEKDVTLVVNSAWGKEITIDSTNVLAPESSRVYYPLSYLFENLKNSTMTTTSGGSYGTVTVLLPPQTGDDTVVLQPYGITDKNAGILEGLQYGTLSEDGIEVLDGKRIMDDSFYYGFLLIAVGLLTAGLAKFINAKKRHRRAN